MKRTYKIDRSKEEIVEVLKGLVEKEAENTFKAHLRRTFDDSCKDLIMGTQDQDRFSFWAILQTRWRFSRLKVNGLFPIIQVRVHGGKPILLEFSHKMDPVGLILTIVVYALLIFAVTVEVVIQDNMETQFVINRILASLVLLFFFTFPLMYFYHVQAKTFRKEILKKLPELPE